MNLLTMVIGGFFGLLLVMFAVLLVIAIVFNLAAGKRYRQSLAARLNRLRLSKMLTALGIDTDNYLHSERMVDIHQQMQRCAGCGQTAECDDKLANGAIDASRVGFCDNEQALVKIVEQKKSA